MINALKEITKTWTGFIHYKRFLLPSGGYLSEKSYLEFLDENLTLRLPFKRVFIEYEIDKSTSNIRIEKANFAIGLKETYISFGKNELLENVIEMTPFMKYKGEIWHIFPKIWLPSKQKIKGKKDNLDGILDYRYSEEWKDKRVVAGHVHTTLGFVNALSNRNISISKEKVISAIAAPDPKPYDSYWILKVNKTIATNSQSLGGTHARPREHDRKGYWRRQHTKMGEKRVYIESTTINKGIGFRIHKDYSLE